MPIRKSTRPAGEVSSIAERRAIVWRYRVAGMSIYKIADRLKADHGISITPPTVAEDIKATLAELKELELSSAEQWRDNECAKLDAIIESQLAAMSEGGIRQADSANAATRAIEAKAKLLGLPAPLDIKDASKLTWTDLVRIRMERKRKEGQ